MYKQIFLKKWKSGRGYRYLMKCVVCNKKFEIVGGAYNLGRGKYCSISCRGKDMIGKPAPNPFKKGHIPYNKGKKRPEFSGQNNPCWKGGKVKIQGYWWVLNHKHPRRNGHYVKMCIVVAEKHLKRKLTSQEIIHHINNKRDDDRPKNLYLFPNISAHKKYHGNQYIKNKPKPLISNLPDCQ